MSLRSLLTLATLAVVPSYAQNQTTWVVTSFITEIYSSSSTVKYDSTPVTPVQRSTSLDIVTSYTTEAPSSQDKTVTHWVTEQVTLPVSTYTEAVTTTLSTPLKITSNGTSTIVNWVSPVLATVTLSPTACADSVSPARSTPPSKVVTEYTGTYSPFPGQVTTTPTAWPTAVTTYIHLTVSSRVLTHIGSTVTVTSTATGYNWLSTTTVSTNKTFTVAPFKYTSTVYLHTLTTTSSDYQLAYTTAAATACPETPTVTRAAQCAPSNLIAERDNHGAAIQLLPLDWAFPIGFPSTLIGIPGMDASACCQLCLDNEGCAASEWTIEWSGACRLYYYVHGNDTCGADVTLEYYGDSHAFPRQASYVQAGCGQLKYYGVKDPFCPTCEVTA
ncbi:hypothetical protein GGS26DRAFT_64786 [Hypomontagnella submonticulosa]|nr:hypothetical protein GGS26DRAFT_64786 [Hypomontagnella submonticulosa]